MISGNIKVSQIKLCTVIALLKTLENTISEILPMTSQDVITKTMGKLGPP